MHDDQAEEGRRLTETHPRDSVGIGVLLAVAWHLMVLAGLGLLATLLPGGVAAFLFLYPLLLVGVAQFLYLPFLALRQRRLGPGRVGQGHLDRRGADVLLLNAGCWGLVAVANL